MSGAFPVESTPDTSAAVASVIKIGLIYEIVLAVNLNFRADSAQGSDYVISHGY